MKISTATTTPFQKAEAFRRVFMDPPDASTLTGTQRQGTSSSASAPGSTIDTSNEGPDLGSGRFCGLQFTDTGVSARNIFLAARFLSERLPEILYTAVKDETTSLTRDGKTFKKLAADLEKAEPSLRGVTGIALYSTYDRLVQHYHFSPSSRWRQEM
ncbi:hypothetical protein B0O80DRAFT_501049 [Mortierella sp. GBAus27b]|nr:hypothetical protein B0O80DRAFT_501049 [Mortierella sp. GBAus27b]